MALRVTGGELLHASGTPDWDRRCRNVPQGLHANLSPRGGIRAWAAESEKNLSLGRGSRGGARRLPRDLPCAWISSSSLTASSPSLALSSACASVSGETSPRPSHCGASPPFPSGSSRGLQRCPGSPRPHHLPAHLLPTHHLPCKPTQSPHDPGPQDLSPGQEQWPSYSEPWGPGKMGSRCLCPLPSTLGSVSTLPGKLASVSQ